MMEISKFYEKCKLLKFDCIKEELDSYLSDFNLDEINMRLNKFVCSFSDNRGNKLVIEFDSNSIYLVKTTNNVVERVNIDNNLILTKQVVEKRINGVIFSEEKKLFAKSKIYDNKIILVEVDENRFVFSKENIENMFSYNNYKYENIEPMQLLLQIKICDYKDELQKNCNLNTRFSAFVNYFLPWYSFKRTCDDVNCAKVYLNGIDISDLYSIVSGPNKINQISALYNGVINEKNEEDIGLIRLGNLSENCFGLRDYLEITEKEDKIVGKSLRQVDLDYVDYLKNLFSERYNYQKDFSVDRKTLLEIIKSNVSNSDVTKNLLERICNFPYSAFDKLDFIEQYNLAKDVYKKKKIKSN